MIATSERSMPRLITISPMPRPSTPRMEILRNRFRRLETVAKPFSVRPNTIRSAMVIRSTICSWLGFANIAPRRDDAAGTATPRDGDCTLIVSSRYYFA
ncbi:hypothetical protein ACVJF0_002696 [Bradyrhizobium elkanii]